MEQRRNITINAPYLISADEIARFSQTLVQTLGHSTPVDIEVIYEHREDVAIHGVRFLNPILMGAVSRLEQTGFAVTGPHRPTQIRQ